MYKTCTPFSRYKKELVRACTCGISISHSGDTTEEIVKVNRSARYVFNFIFDDKVENSETLAN